MWFILDLIIVAILVVFALLAAKKGFVKSVIEIAGFVLAIFLAFTLSSPATNFIYDKAINPAIHSTIEAAVGDTYSNIDSAVTENITNKLPGFIADNANLDVSGILNDSYASPSEVADAVCANVVQPVVTAILNAVITAILLVVLLIVFKFLAKFINKLFSFSIIGKANKILGAVVGLIKGAGVAVIFVAIISFIVNLNGDFLIFTKENIASTLLFDFISGILPFNF